MSTFEEWLTEWADEIEQAQLFTKSALPVNHLDIQKDLSRTTTEYPRMAELLAEVEGHIVTARAVETLAVKKDSQYGELSAPERKTVVEARLVAIMRTRDILKATVAALHGRSFVLLNQRRFAEAEMRMAPHSEG